MGKSARLEFGRDILRVSIRCKVGEHANQVEKTVWF